MVDMGPSFQFTLGDDSVMLSTLLNIAHAHEGVNGLCAKVDYVLKKLVALSEKI